MQRLERDARVAAEVRVHRRRQQPQLEDDDEHDEDEDAVDDGHPLGSDEVGACVCASRAVVHVADSSMPIA